MKRKKETLCRGSVKKLQGTCQICGGEGFIETQYMQTVYSAGFVDMLPLM